jgi:[protein-PII] uridylyltransferase
LVAPVVNTDPRTRLAYLKPLRYWLAAERAAIKARYLKRPQPDRNLRQHSSVVDELISRIATDIGLPNDVALLAVGGYGRGFLFPASDVDVLVLLPEREYPASHTGTIEAFVSLLWDVGLEPGISVRTISECVEEASKDITVDTSMLEARWLWGDRQLVTKLSAQLNRARALPAFLEAKLDEQRRRHARHHDIALNLEPNIKESPGGLRDLQTVLWIARAANIGGDALADWSALASAGLLTNSEAKLIAKHRRVLIDLRIRLHYLAGRREDRLVFDHQTTLAEQLKLKPTRARLASEVLMRRYYLSAKIIWQLNSILLANLSEKILRKKRDVVRKINEDFELVNGNLAAIDVGMFQRDPRAIFHAFLALQRTQEAEFFAAETLRAIWRQVPNIGPAFREDRNVNDTFLEILQSERLTFTLRRLSRYGILGRYLPAFGRIVGQMQHDLFHVYTVDEHILMVLRNMRRLVLPRFSHEFPFCHELASAFKEKHLLYLACLFHDIAKGRGGDHSKLGTRDARRFCRQLGLPQPQIELVEWLVETHLMMSATAQKQDLSDPEVISQFAALVGDEYRLTALYLLTVADIRGTSPHVWNGWKAKLLEELFRATRRLLRGDSAINPHFIEFKRRDALARMNAETEPPIWQHVNERYFQRFDVDDLTWHAKAIGEEVAPIEPRIFVREDDHAALFEVLVMTPDEVGVFARITNAFERMQFDIVSARIYTTTNGYALDSFLVLPKSRQTSRNLSHSPAMSSERSIQKELTKVLLAAEIPEPTHARSARQAKHFPLVPEISLRKSRVAPFYEIGITCADKPGLLSAIARAFNESNINLHDARITTLGSRAEDVFIVEHAKLAESDFADSLKRTLLEAVT